MKSSEPLKKLTPIEFLPTNPAKIELITPRKAQVETNNKKEIVPIIEQLNKNAGTKIISGKSKDSRDEAMEFALTGDREKIELKEIPLKIIQPTNDADKKIQPISLNISNNIQNPDSESSVEILNEPNAGTSVTENIAVDNNKASPPQTAMIIENNISPEELKKINREVQIVSYTVPGNVARTLMDTIGTGITPDNYKKVIENIEDLNENGGTLTSIPSEVASNPVLLPQYINNLANAATVDTDDEGDDLGEPPTSKGITINNYPEFKQYVNQNRYIYEDNRFANLLLQYTNDKNLPEVVKAINEAKDMGGFSGSSNDSEYLERGLEHNPDSLPDLIRGLVINTEPIFLELKPILTTPVSTTLLLRKPSGVPTDKPAASLPVTKPSTISSITENDTGANSLITTPAINTPASEQKTFVLVANNEPAPAAEPLPGFSSMPKGGNFIEGYERYVLIDSEVCRIESSPDKWVVTNGKGSIVSGADINNNVYDIDSKLLGKFKGKLTDKNHDGYLKDKKVEHIPIPMVSQTDKNTATILKELSSDGVINIGVFIGRDETKGTSIADSDFLIRGSQPDFKDYQKTILIDSKPVLVNIRMLFSNKAAQAALGTYEMFVVDSHSRSGLGWQGYSSDQPINMNKGEDGKIGIDTDLVNHYLNLGILGKGRIVDKTSNGETIVSVNNSDFKNVIPYSGYQVIVGGSCQSGPHFLDDLVDLRKGLPTTLLLNRDIISSGGLFDVVTATLFTDGNEQSLVKRLNARAEVYEYNQNNTWFARTWSPLQKLTALELKPISITTVSTTELKMPPATATAQDNNKAPENLIYFATGKGDNR